MPKKIKREDFHLYLRTDKKKKDGRMPLYIRFKRIDGEEPKFPLRGYSYSFDEWDREKQSPIQHSDEDELANEIDRIIRNINVKTIDEGFEMNKSLLKRIVAGEKIRKPEEASFYDYFNSFLSIRLQNKTIGETTRQSYQTTFNALKEFRKSIRIKDINARLLKSFDDFMIQRGNKKGKGNVHGSRRNRHKHIQTIIQYINAKHIQIENPYKTGELSIPEDRPNEVFLDFREFMRMYSLMDKLTEKTIEHRVLLIYLFSCIEALRISDALAVKWEDINVKRLPMILKYTTRKKTRRGHVTIVTPIFKLAEKILVLATENDINKLKYENKIFDYGYTTKQINDTLKKLAKMVNIQKDLTFHSSRRTYATLASAQGASLTQIQKYMGHSNPGMTMRYIKNYENKTNYPHRGHDLFSIRLKFMKEL